MLRKYILPILLALCFVGGVYAFPPPSPPSGVIDPTDID